MADLDDLFGDTAESATKSVHTSLKGDIEIGDSTKRGNIEAGSDKLDCRGENRVDEDGADGVVGGVVINRCSHTKACKKRENGDSDFHCCC